MHCHIIMIFRDNAVDSVHGGTSNEQQVCSMCIHLILIMDGDN